MAVFDPNDWWEGPSWLTRPARRERRRPEEINRLVGQRWLATAAFCLCFASLGPPGHLALTFAGLLLAAALASSGVALITRERPSSPHLTAWDEAALSLAVALGTGLWLTPPS